MREMILGAIQTMREMFLDPWEMPTWIKIKRMLPL
jgi:hypothetical protein